MSMRKLLLCLLIVAGSASAPLSALARGDIYVEVAPPPARVEVVPEARRGWVWAPGYWRWNGRRHIWVEGHWVRERRGAHWVPEHWVQEGPRHHFVPGHWER
jgi:hypothetical protein